MNIIEAIRKGFRNVGQSKRYIFFVYLVNLVVAMIFAAILAGTLKDSLGSSKAAENMTMGFDGLWYNNFRAEASGLTATFEPGVVGIGAILKSVNDFISGNLGGNFAGIALMGIVFMLLWTYFAGGFISFYAKQDEQKTFFQNAANFLPRFIVLWLMATILYFLLFVVLMSWLSGLVDSLTRETLDERIHFVYTVIKYGIVWTLVWFVNMLFDYSKIITVLQDHNNALTAPLKAGKIIFENLGKTYGLYLSIGVFWVLFFVIYWIIVVDPRSASGWLTIFVPFVLGQFYILSRIWTRCLFYAGQTAMCESIIGNE